MTSVLVFVKRRPEFALNQPHPLLDLFDGLPGDDRGSLGTIGEDIVYISGFGSYRCPLFPERFERGINAVSQKRLAINAADFG